MKIFVFIGKVMSKGFSVGDAMILSMYKVCCDDYAWLSRRSKKNLSFLVQRVKKRYGKKAYKLAYQLNDRPDVKSWLAQAWADCGYTCGGCAGKPNSSAFSGVSASKKGK